MEAKKKALQLVYKIDKEIYFTDRVKALDLALIRIDEQINLIKELLDSSTKVYQSLSTPNKLCVDILNPKLKHLEQVKKEILNL